MGDTCKTDADCPCSYCMNDKSKTPPYQCHADMPGTCCKTDKDCPGSYCVNYHGPPPYHCHATSSVEEARVGEDALGELLGSDTCKTDADCPCSYCMNDKSKTPPYQCHADMPSTCCKTDKDCPGSYCVNYHGPPPYHCHATSSVE